MNLIPPLLLTATLAGAPSVSFAAQQRVLIDQHMFMPTVLNVHPGDEVTWINKDSDPHTVTSDDHGKTFRSLVLDPGQKFSWTFRAPGTFAYYCTVHPYMQGKITVK